MIVIGVVVGAVLVRESKSLLIGDCAARDLTAFLLAYPRSKKKSTARMGSSPRTLRLTRVVLALSLDFSDSLRTPEIERAVQTLETRVRNKHPEIVALCVKPQSRRQQDSARRSPLRSA